jgi:hypothetical protein
MRAARSSRGRRLSDTLDKLLFVGVFVLGVAGILAGKLLGVHQFVISATVVGLMTLYVAVCWRAAIAQFREDVVADNVYYLGFLFTLTSLGVALYQIQNAAESLVETLLANFGIALMSTIAGVFLRVLISQFRRDPAEVERQSRLELVDASSRMRTQLNQTAEAFNDFRAQMIQLVREGTELSVRRQDEAIQQQIRALEEGSRAMIRLLVNDLAGPVAEGAKSLARATAVLAEHSEALTGVTRDSTANVQRSAADLSRAMEAAARKTAIAADNGSTMIGTAIERAALLAEQSREAQLAAIRALSDRMTELREMLAATGKAFGAVPAAVKSAAEESLVVGRALVADNARHMQAQRALEADLVGTLRAQLERLATVVDALGTTIDAAMNGDAEHDMRGMLREVLDRLPPPAESEIRQAPRTWRPFGR